MTIEIPVWLVWSLFLLWLPTSILGTVATILQSRVMRRKVRQLERQNELREAIIANAEKLKGILESKGAE